MIYRTYSWESLEASCLFEQRSRKLAIAGWSGHQLATRMRSRQRVLDPPRKQTSLTLDYLRGRLDKALELWLFIPGLEGRSCGRYWDYY
jgi:hypothetical protein